MRKLLVIVAALVLAVPIFASKHRKDVPAAPLPASIGVAKRAFVTNGGGSSLAFDEFYQQIKEWGRFEIVGSPAEADVILEIKYFVEDHGNRVWSATNTYTGQTQVYSARDVDPQLSMNIYDAHSKDLLWTATDHRRLARFEKNREKETINSADRLVAELKQRIQPAP